MADTPDMPGGAELDHTPVLKLTPDPVPQAPRADAVGRRVGEAVRSEDARDSTTPPGPGSRLLGRVVVALGGLPARLRRVLRVRLGGVPAVPDHVAGRVPARPAAGRLGLVGGDL